MQVLLLLLLAGCVLADSAERPARQIYGNTIDLRPTPTYGPPVGPKPCHPSVVYRTKVVHSTIVIPSVVYNNNIRYVTQTNFRTNRIYSTFVSLVLRTKVVPSVLVRTVTVTRTLGSTRTQTETNSGQGNVVTRTQEVVSTRVQFQTKVETRFQQVPSTVVRTVVSTTVVQQQQFSTIFETKVFTRTQQLPGQTRTIDSTQFSTVFSTVFFPGQDVTSTQTVVSTSFVTQTITQGGQTQFITSTQFIPVTSTVFSQLVVTNTQTSFITRTETQTQTSTVFQTQQVSQVVTSTVTVPQQVVSTLVSLQVIPTTIIRQQVFPTVVTVPGLTQVRTVFRTLVKTQPVPGLTRTLRHTQVIYNTNYHTSTIVKVQYSTVLATHTIHPICTKAYGYRRPTPAHSHHG